jgi:FSR family fosmidomycin resistance protein-like MFS transporter
MTSPAAAVAKEIDAPKPLPSPEGTLIRVLAAVSFCHLVNDMIQSLLPSIYPILKSSFHLNFSQIGLITLTFQITASLLQPFIGHFTDRAHALLAAHRHDQHPGRAGPAGLCAHLRLLLIAASLFGIGSAIFHPESSRVARMASGGKHGFAQSFFQVGGNTGSAIGPLLAAFIILPSARSAFSGSPWPPSRESPSSPGLAAGTKSASNTCSAGRCPSRTS